MKHLTLNPYRVREAARGRGRICSNHDDDICNLLKWRKLWNRPAENRNISVGGD